MSVDSPGLTMLTPPIDMGLAAFSKSGGASSTLDHAAAELRAGRPRAAEAIARAVVEKEPSNAHAWNALGVSLRAQGRPREAIPHYWRAIDIDARQAAAWSNLGNAYKDEKRLASALECHRRALHLSPQQPGSLHNLAVALTAAAQHREALETLDQALALKPDNTSILWDRALTLLHLGDYEQGWPAYETRLKLAKLPKRNPPGERWQGERYDGRRLLLISEQGYGDTLWVARYLRQVKSLGGELILECRPALVPLMQAMGVADHVVPKADPL